MYLKCIYLCDLCRSKSNGLVVLRSSYGTDRGQRQHIAAIVAGIIAGVAVLAATCGAFIYNKRKRTISAQQGRNVHVSYY